VWVVRKLSHDLPSGMRLIFALLVFLPTSLRIELPGAFPQFTIHRLLIVVAFIFLIRNRDPNRKRWPIPAITLVLLLGLSQFVSLVLGTQFVAGIKGFLNYIIEVALFYVLISEYIQTEKEIVQLLSCICYGLAAVAIVATIEKYFHVNLVEKVLPSSGAAWIEAGNITAGDITSTYPHRILLGYAMVMGVPLSLALSSQFGETRPGRVMYGIALLLIGATYFSMSRGPWLGVALAVVGIAVLGGKGARRKVVYIALVAAAILIFRPGVRETIQNLYSATLDENSQKGSSYQTRWELWTVAWKEIQKSPERLIFGYGPASTESMDLSDYWYGQEGYSSSMTKIGHTSWDNNYAADLIELGLIGLVLEMILFLSIIRTLVDNWRRSDPEIRIVSGGVTVACLVFMFAMTNVFIFAPQLKYLFWALVAIGCNFARAFADQMLSEPTVNLDCPAPLVTGVPVLAEGEAAIRP
jgi:O-antigen ligase